MQTVYELRPAANVNDPLSEKAGRRWDCSSVAMCPVQGCYVLPNKHCGSFRDPRCVVLASYGADAARALDGVIDALGAEASRQADADGGPPHPVRAWRPRRPGCVRFVRDGARRALGP